MVNDNIFAIMGDKTIRLYSRPDVVYVPPPVPGIKAASVTSKPAKKKWISKKDKAAMIAAGIDPDADPSREASAEPSVASSLEPVQKYNTFTRTGRLNIFHNRMCIGKSPTLLRSAGKDKLMIGFDDGSVQVLFCPTLVDPAIAVKKANNPVSMQITLGAPMLGENAEKVVAQEPAEGTLAAVLCEFQAHYVADQPATSSFADVKDAGSVLGLGGSSVEGSYLDDITEASPEGGAANASMKPRKLGVRAAVLCPWTSCSGGHGLGYQLELLTVGSDRRIAHWGIRFKANEAEVVLAPHFANATRASTAQMTEINNEEEGGAEDELNVEVDQGSLADRSIEGTDIPMESDLLGVTFIF